MSFRGVFKCWWPLAASWLLMAFEVPIIIFVLGRMPDPQRSVAAFGGVALPIAFILEAPILMFLSASTALCKDLESFRRLRAFMHSLSAVLTLMFIAVPCTPLYDFVAGTLLAVPEELKEGTRQVLIMMTPWIWAVADRRFHQGVLIRYGYSRFVGNGTALRLLSLSTFLVVVKHFDLLHGAGVGGLAVSVAVLSEAAYVRLKVAPVVRDLIPVEAPRGSKILTGRAMIRFYTPLALTSLLGMLLQPLGSASLSRMADPLASLAVWPALGSLVFAARSMCIAITEVVVARIEDPEDGPALFPFCKLLMIATTGTLLLVAVTPLSRWWFEYGAAFPEALVEYGRLTIFLALPLPAVTALQSWYQAHLLHAHRTRPITEAIALFLGLTAVLLWAGVEHSTMRGLYYFHAVILVGSVLQTWWLYRAKQRLYS